MPIGPRFGTLRDVLWSFPDFSFVKGGRKRNSPITFSAAQIRRQLEMKVGGSTGSRQTATAADALEIDVSPRHEGDTQTAVGGDHVAHCAMDSRRPCHQVKVLLMTIKTGRRAWRNVWTNRANALRACSTVR
jgi:hypothetical protein